MTALVWFRRDLRIRDNPALYYAAKESQRGVFGLYLITPRQWKGHDDADCKVKFWLDNVAALSVQLANLNIPLLIKMCDDFSAAPETILSIARRYRISALFANREYEVNEVRRDSAVAEECERAGIRFQQYHDRVIVPPLDIRTVGGRFYSVFTPYRKVWDSRACEFLETVPVPAKQPHNSVRPAKIPATIEGFEISSCGTDLWPAGEAEAERRLANFIGKIENYHTARDIPSHTGTSLLSPYLAAGVISPRHCLTAAMTANNGRISGRKGPTTWISELAWRDFYTQVLVACPRVSMHQPYKLKTLAIRWRNDAADFDAWKEGRTGFPIVDAAMRQLNRTGWMHNRLRMIAAMFLTKHLLIDWRWGEQYFMQRLIDGDLAANNGGWQWSASTGTDAVPYFRIFNPFSQSQRFDPDGAFVRKMCPELKDVPVAALHDPRKLAAAIKEMKIDYPNFIVDHQQGRQRALDAFKRM
jgi:deoxyribodipyrimidine photo-lyase